MICTRCEGTGFLNIFQLPGNLQLAAYELRQYLIDHEDQRGDITVCDCCGNGEDWYGIPGEHYTSLDPSGPNGPYAYNGGLCECN